MVGMQRSHGQRGGALVEFVIVLPLLVMVLFSLWEFGRVFDAWMVATNAAREGARYGFSAATDSEVQQKTRDYLEAAYGGRLKFLDSVSKYADGDVTAFTEVGHPAIGQLQVKVTSKVDIWAPGSINGGSFRWSFPLLDANGRFTVTAWSVMYQ